MDVHLGLPDAAAARGELAALGPWAGIRAPRPAEPGPGGRGHREHARWDLGPGEAVLATWHRLLDPGRMQDGEPFLAGTARAVVARMSPATTAEVGTIDGGRVTVATDHGSVTAAVQTTAMPDRVVWLPTHSLGGEGPSERGARPR